MAVMFGSARSDENGGARGGRAGDQTGREVMRQAWYKSDKGWMLLRPRDAVKAGKIADCMSAACDNPHIGYDQYQRNTLYNAAKAVGFDCSKVEVDCETDCSALVRVCCAYAGIMVDTAFTTGNQVNVLMATGEFLMSTEDEYTKQSDYLMRGDILVTATRGHTVVVLTDGPMAGEYSDTPEISRGSYGEAVKRAQERLMVHGQKLQFYGADGDFGGETASAVRAFQKAKGLDADGVVGPLTWAALLEEPIVKPFHTYTLKSQDLNLLERLQGIYGGTVT